MNRKHIAIDSNVHESLSEDKPDGVTWTYFLKELHRLANTGEGEGIR